MRLKCFEKTERAFHISAARQNHQFSLDLYKTYIYVVYSTVSILHFSLSECHFVKQTKVFDEYIQILCTIEMMW